MALTRRLLWSAGLTLLALCLAAAWAVGVGAPEDGGNGSPLGDGVWETEGDWSVEDGEVATFENLTLILNGNLTVEFGGTLSLANVEMVVNCTEELQYAILVETQATLEVADWDGDAATTDDRSLIRSWYESARYTLTFSGGSTGRVLRSRIADMGSDEVTGLEIASDDVEFRAAIIESFSSIYVEKAAPKFIGTRITGDLSSSLYFLEAAATIEGCTIINCYYALNARGNPAPAVVDTDVANCFFPLNLELSSVTMTGGLLEAAPYGTEVRLNQSSEAVLTDVEFDRASVLLLDSASVLKVRWTLSLRVTDQTYVALEGASVSVNDSRGQRVFTGTTDEEGRVSIELLDYTQNNTTTDMRNPHAIKVSKGRYHGTVRLNVTSTMSRELTVMTNLKPVIQILSPLSGTRVVMGQTIVLDASPTYDPNGDALTFNWTTNIGDRLLYSGPSPVTTTSLLLGETEVTLTVSDGEGGVNATTVSVEVLPSSQASLSLSQPQFIASLSVTYGGTGQVMMEEAEFPGSHPKELIGVFIQVRTTGDAILASGELEVSYLPELLPFGMDEATLGIALEDGGIWVDVPGSEVDVEAHVVTATITKVGIYAIKGVMPPNIPPRIWFSEDGELVPLHDLEVEAGETIDITIYVEDELPSFAKLEIGELPEFLRMDSTTKRVWGTAPGEPGSYNLAIKVTDIEGLEAQDIIVLQVTGRMDPPELWGGIVDPTKGDTGTNFEISVVYRSPEELPPEYVRVRFLGENDTIELTPIDPSDDNYLAGVMYHTFIRLRADDYRLVFETSDGTRANATTEALALEVESSSFQPTEMEWAVIALAIIAIIVILSIIHMTSERFEELKKAHLGRDREDRLEYITPEVAEADEEAPEGEAPEDVGLEAPEGPELTEEGEPVHVLETDEEGMRALETDVERLEEELGDIDEEIDREEEDLARIDEDIEEIIDELDDDRDRVD